MCDLFQVSLLVAVVFVVHEMVVEGEVAVEVEVALAEALEVVVEDEGDLVAGAEEEVEKEGEDVEVVRTYLGVCKHTSYLPSPGQNF
jgi:hypothetical protein